MTLITETIIERQINVLGAITAGHTENQAEFARIVGEMESANALYMDFVCPRVARFLLKMNMDFVCRARPDVVEPDS